MEEVGCIIQRERGGGVGRVEPTDREGERNAAAAGGAGGAVASLAVGGGHVLGGGGGSARHNLAFCMNRNTFGHDSLAWEIVLLHEQVRHFDFTIYDLKFEAVTLL